MTEPVRVKKAAGRLELLLNRPGSRNALSQDLLAALSVALDEQIGPGTAEVIITGAGDCFSAGADFRELNGTIDDIWIDEAIALVTGKIRRTPATVIALVNGPCVGGAVDIALNCDLIRCTANAFFQVPASELGLLYNPVAVKRLVERYGKELVTRVFVNGERIDAQTALALGIVSSVSGEAPAQAEEQVPPSNPAGKAAKATSDMIDAIERGAFDPGYWEKVRREILQSDERSAAIASFKARMQKPG